MSEILNDYKELIPDKILNDIREEIKDKKISQAKLKEILERTKKEYEESLVSDSEVERLLVKYHLSKSYKRRVKRIYRI